MITGRGFRDVSGPDAVTFGGVSATSYTVISPTKITAIAPAHALATVAVQVWNSGGSER